MKIIKDLKYKCPRVEVRCSCCKKKRIVSQKRIYTERSKIFLCRKCSHIKRFKKRQIFINGKEYKKCTKCNKLKQVSDFLIIKHKYIDSHYPYCRDCHCKKTKNYYNKNKKYLRNWLNKYYKNRRKTDPAFRLVQVCRRRISSSISQAKVKKSNKSIPLLGCSPSELVKYIESKWENGMTWENHGSGPNFWQIDHIKACCCFNLTKEEEQKKCFHYTNLQPIWYEDHLKKTIKDREFINEKKKNV